MWNSHTHVVSSQEMCAESTIPICDLDDSLYALQRGGVRKKMTLKSLSFIVLIGGSLPFR